MKLYNTPETQVLQVNNQFALCEGSGGESKSVGTGIQNMPRQKLTVQWV